MRHALLNAILLTHVIAYHSCIPARSEVEGQSTYLHTGTQPEAGISVDKICSED